MDLEQLADAVTAQLIAQLKDSRPYLVLSLGRGESLQLVLFVNMDGDVGNPKYSMTGRKVDNARRPPVTSLTR